jgi:adenylosuccinate synthase
VGVIKAYSTRVGAGPFPTEQDNSIGEHLRERGKEYGTTTGRPRRCGWFDAFAVRYTAGLSGVTELALSLLDVPGGLEEVRICTGYRIGGDKLEQFDPTVMSQAECTYESSPGWSDDISNCRTFEELPAEAQRYVERIEELVGRSVGVISIGEEREQTIIHNTKIPGLK